MNQEKIGAFIAKARKEKNMTQKELAERLNVTDRAIGNWENGRRLPDYSIIKDLCNNLGITINELFASEYIDEKDKEKQFDKNILNVLKTNKKNKKKINIIILCISITLFLVLSYIGKIILINKGFLPNPNLAYVKRYEHGYVNQKGDVKYELFEEKNIDFEIGANKYGYAVFKNPTKAFNRLKKDYAKGIKAIQKEFKLAPLNMFNFRIYGIYGWQLTTGTDEEKQEAKFVSSFMDIYEDSFN